MLSCADLAFLEGINREGADQAMDTEAIVFIVDDDSSARKSLSWLLQSADYRTQAFATADEFLEYYNPEIAGCLLLDMRMPGAGGLQVQSLLAEREITLPVIFISGHVDVPTASQAFRAGACDVLTKPIDDGVLLERVAEALAKDRQNRYVSRQLQDRLQQLDKLTPKEREVFTELLKGRTIKQLATHFNVGFQTVAKHRARVLEKLGVDTDAQLIRVYQEDAASLDTSVQ